MSEAEVEFHKWFLDTFRTQALDAAKDHQAMKRAWLASWERCEQLNKARDSESRSRW